MLFFKKLQGFTLIELLIVIAIMGLLSTLAMVSLNRARQQSRDAQRMSDIKEIQTGLELYLQNNNTYPIEADVVTLGSSGAGTLCLDNGGFAASCSEPIYIGRIPAAPTPPTGNVYTYQSQDASGAPCSSNCANYAIEFTTEGIVSGINCSSGCTASAAGIQ